MKKIVKAISLGMLFLTCVPISSCGGKTNHEHMKTYRELYDGNRKTKYDALSPNDDRFRASYGYIANDQQGHNYWYYYQKTTTYEQLRYDTKKARFIGKKSYIENGIHHVYKDESTALGFLSPRAGTSFVSGTVRMNQESKSDARVAIYLNDTKIVDDIFLSKNDTIGYFFQQKISLSIGDELRFVISGENAEVYINPTIDFSSTINDSLYKTPEWGYYGDIHAYYYKDMVYLYHLQNLGDAVSWEWHLDTTKDMFRYERASIYDTSFVQNHYMAYATAGDLNDYSLYPDGARDCTLFYSEDTNNYRYIGLTYKKRSGIVNCDLSMRTSESNDVFGEWGHAQPLREFPNNSGEPECAAFRKIGNTWYLYCGISGQSVHGVGGLSYWKGKPGKNIDQTNWRTETTYRLDGEDLCVPQIEEIGGRYYMWGWMPQNYCGNQWGGYKNLPREVFVREDGLLGTRLDEMATKLVNKGKLLTADETNTQIVSGTGSIENRTIQLTGSDNKVSLQGSYDSTFVTYDLHMEDATKAGYILKVQDKEYQILMNKKESGTFLEVGSPQDSWHPISSSLYFGDRSLSDFQIKIAIEGGVIEFYVNDTLTLSARTALPLQATYEPMLYANGSATFQDVTIHRLAQEYDIYD